MMDNMNLMVTEMDGAGGGGGHDTPTLSEFDISKEEIREGAIDSTSLSSTPINHENETASNANIDSPSIRQPPRVDDWDGPDDPENPHNWSLWLRAYHTAIPALFGFAV
jgi:hypothetical protein